MAQQHIITGTTANDGTGDPLRTAFIKTEQNFNELYASPPGTSGTSGSSGTAGSAGSAGTSGQNGSSGSSGSTGTSGSSGSSGTSGTRGSSGSSGTSGTRGSSGSSGSSGTSGISIDDGFICDYPDQSFNGPILGMDHTPYSDIIVCGDFTFGSAFSLAKLNFDGTINEIFQSNLGSGFNKTAISVAIQPDGKILVGGEGFGYLNGNTIPGDFVRLNPDGTTDTIFNTNLGTGFDNSINTIAIQPDGKILVGGKISNLNGNTIPNGIIRLNSDADPDTIFNTNLGSGTDDIVLSIIVQLDGKILVGGSFITFNGNSRYYMFRLNPDGTEDTAFYSNYSASGGANFNVLTFGEQSDGKILVGGKFNLLNGYTRNYMFRLNPDGTEDTAFYTNLGAGFDDYVSSIVVQSDDKILVGGNFTYINGNISKNLTRFFSNGLLDTTFVSTLNGGFDGLVNSISEKSDGRIFVGGIFSYFNISYKRSFTILWNLSDIRGISPSVGYDYELLWVDKKSPYGYNATPNLFWDKATKKLTIIGTSGNTVFDVQGDSGQLFSVTDNLIGILHSVNDISGIPIFTVNSDKTVTVDGVLKINSLLYTGLTTNTDILTFPMSSGTGAFFDYYVKNDGFDARLGTIMCVWVSDISAQNIEYTEYSTTDIDYTYGTGNISFDVAISGSDIVLTANITSNTWEVKVGVRLI